jgi:hypothetical protein
VTDEFQFDVQEDGQVTIRLHDLELFRLNPIQRFLTVNDSLTLSDTVTVTRHSGDVNLTGHGEVSVSAAVVIPGGSDYFGFPFWTMVLGCVEATALSYTPAEYKLVALALLVLANFIAYDWAYRTGRIK